MRALTLAAAASFSSSAINSVKASSSLSIPVSVTDKRPLAMKEIAETVADPLEVDSEIRFLFAALRGES
jgi:hypothetical protein